MHYSLEGFFLGILLQLKLLWEVGPPCLTSVIWRTMNTRSFICSTGIIMQPGSLQGSRGEQGSGLLPHTPALTICSVLLVWQSVPCGCQGPHLWFCYYFTVDITPWLQGISSSHHMKHLAMLTATARTASGYRSVFHWVLWTEKSNGVRKAFCGAYMLL